MSGAAPTQLVTLAAYLPQFHEIPENDAWWGRGFTEWTHLRKARPWFRGHEIRSPSSELGYYTLPDRGVMEKQNELAKAAGINGFAVWDYWFGAGERLLEKPIEAVLSEGFDFSYALFWANHSWMDKSRGLTLKEQRYLGASDYEAYFHTRLSHFRSRNYLRIDDKPIFGIFDPSSIPDLRGFMDTWEGLAEKCGLAGIYWVSDRPVPATDAHRFQKEGSAFAFWTNKKKLYVNYIKEKLRTKLGIAISPQIYEFSKVTTNQFDSRIDAQRYLPTVLAGWDTTPRHGKRGATFRGYAPRAFAAQLDRLLLFFEENKVNRPMVLIKSWNEWAEGNAIEPDSKDGKAYLDLYKSFVDEINSLPNI